MFTEHTLMRRTDVLKEQEDALEDYINRGAFAFRVHLETSPNFRKILMNVASERGHYHVMRYCILKAKQDRAQKDVEEEAKYMSKHTHHPTDTQLLRQEKVTQVLVHAESELHALRAKMLAYASPDDPGMRVIYERMLAGVTMNERTVKEIEKFANPWVYKDTGFRHKYSTESTKRTDTLVMLRCEHFDRLIVQYKGLRMRDDVGAHAVVSWLARRKREAFLGTRAWMLKMNDATGRAAALTSTLEKYAIHLADEQDGKHRVGYKWDFSGQPKSFREEMMESYHLMVSAIDNGWITDWSFGLAGKWGDSTGPRIVSETSLKNGRKMAISLPAPLYWRIFFEIDPPRKTIDVFKDAWIGAGMLYELTRYHVALIQAGVHKRSNETAWLYVLAHEDTAPTEEAVPKEPIATAAMFFPNDTKHLNSLRVLPPPKPAPAPKLTKRDEEREAARLARQLQEACEAEREQRLAAAKKAEAEKKAVEDAKREEKRKRAEAERIRAEAIALEEAEDAEEAAKKTEEARVQQVRESRAAGHLEHAKAQQQKRDPNATGLQRQIAAEAQAAADAEKEAARVAKLAAQQRQAQSVQDNAYANDHEAQMEAKAAEVAAKKAAAKAKKEAEKATKQAKEDAEAVVAEQRRREEQVWAEAQAAPAPALAPNPTSAAAPADCIICMDTKATHIIVPCGHFCLCARCASNQNQCPLCRAPAVHIIQGFF